MLFFRLGIGFNNRMPLYYVGSISIEKQTKNVPIYNLRTDIPNNIVKIINATM